MQPKTRKRVWLIGVPLVVVAGTAGAAPAAATAGQRTEVTTDVFKLTFDSNGGSLVGAQLLKYPEDSKNAKSQPIVLMQDTPSHQYLAQTGLAGGNLPSHLTPMALVTP